MDVSVKKTIRQRVSVRTFDGSGLGETDRAALVRYMERVTNPFDVPVEFRLFRAGEHGLSSPVVVGADYYIAAKVPRQGNYEMGYGYSFEVLCLWARSLGIGTVLSTFGAGAIMQAVYSVIRFEPRDLRHKDILEVTKILLNGE